MRNIDSGNFEKAINDFDKAMELYPTFNMHCYMALAKRIKIYNESLVNNNNKSINIYKTRVYDQRAEFYYSYAEDMSDNDEKEDDFDIAQEYYQKAVEDWNKVLELNPNYQINYFHLAHAEDLTNKKQEAKKHYTIYINRNSDFDFLSMSYFYRGLISVKQEDYKNAIDDYNESIKINMDSPLFIEARAIAYYTWAKSIGNNEMAKEYYKNAVDDWNKILEQQKLDYEIDYSKKEDAEKQIHL